MSAFAIILIILVGVFALYELGTLVYALIKRHKDRKKLKEQKSNEDSAE